jgi:hypothetical protein
VVGCIDGEEVEQLVRGGIGRAYAGEGRGEGGVVEGKGGGKTRRNGVLEVLCDG